MTCFLVPATETLAARAMVTPGPKDHVKLAARSANDECICTLKVHQVTEYCFSDGTGCYQAQTDEGCACITDQDLCNQYADDDYTTTLTQTIGKCNKCSFGRYASDQEHVV